MTHAERKLRKAGIAPEHIVSASTDSVEIAVGLEEVDVEATEEVANRARAALLWGGYRTGYGSWVLQRGYTPRPSEYCTQPA